jgi:hypothetical protein
MTATQLVKERAVALGAEGNLIGLMSEPALPPVPAVVRPVVLFLNAGVIHRVGPHRLHVNLARRLAERGITSLRLDLSGIGDSRSVPGSLSFRQSSVADTRVAMDFLEAELGATRFVIFGLCSGADNALATADVDARVTGLVLLDAPAYVTRQAQARLLAARVGAFDGAPDALAWGAGVVGRRVRAGLERLLGNAAASEADSDEYTGGRKLPPAEVFRAQLAALVDRKVAVFTVYSGALGVRYNHEDQVFELFPELRGKIDRAFFPGANHMFTELVEQRALMQAVLDWLERACRPPAP